MSAGSDSLPGAPAGLPFKLVQLETELAFLGLIGMIDPPRAEAKEAVARAKGAGIRPLMITGDHPRTASVIARELGITADGRAMTGAELAQLDDVALQRTVSEVSVYARVNPEHKLRIVNALQSGGAVIAMTGDGVNDAPALKAADIGVAMGLTGTDVSKEAADIVLADDNFASIVAAVEEGRAIFANIRKFLRYLLSSNIGEVLTMFLGVLLAGPLGLDPGGDAIVLPLLATQIRVSSLIQQQPLTDDPDWGVARPPGSRRLRAVPAARVRDRPARRFGLVHLRTRRQLHLWLRELSKFVTRRVRAT
jgi:P-type Ca2+ transporter type 2C